MISTASYKSPSKLAVTLTPKNSDEEILNRKAANLDLLKNQDLREFHNLQQTLINGNRKIETAERKKTRNFNNITQDLTLEVSHILFEYKTKFDVKHSKINAHYERIERHHAEKTEFYIKGIDERVSTTRHKVAELLDNLTADTILLYDKTEEKVLERARFLIQKCADACETGYERYERKLSTETSIFSYRSD